MQSTGRDPIEGEAALDVLDGVTHLHVAKGKKIQSFDLTRERPDDEELLGMLLGRSGKLRAPVVRVGDTLVVGYNQDVLSKTLL